MRYFAKSLPFDQLCPLRPHPAAPDDPFMGDRGSRAGGAHRGRVKDRPYLLAEGSGTDGRDQVSRIFGFALAVSESECLVPSIGKTNPPWPPWAIPHKRPSIWNATSTFGGRDKNCPPPNLAQLPIGWGSRIGGLLEGFVLGSTVLGPGQLGGGLIWKLGACLGVVPFEWVRSGVAIGCRPWIL